MVFVSFALPQNRNRPPFFHVSRIYEHKPIEIRVRTLVFAHLKEDKERRKKRRKKFGVRKLLVGHGLIDDEKKLQRTI